MLKCTATVYNIKNVSDVKYFILVYTRNNDYKISLV